MGASAPEWTLLTLAWLVYPLFQLVLGGHRTESARAASGAPAAVRPLHAEPVLTTTPLFDGPQPSTLEADVADDAGATIDDSDDQGRPGDDRD